MFVIELELMDTGYFGFAKCPVAVAFTEEEALAEIQRLNEAELEEGEEQGRYSYTPIRLIGIKGRLQ